MHSSFEATKSLCIRRYIRGNGHRKQAYPRKPTKQQQQRRSEPKKRVTAVICSRFPEIRKAKDRLTRES
ncbi:hypothetical protein TKK_0016243 [Trichogramma kaykai]